MKNFFVAACLLLCATLATAQQTKKKDGRAAESKTEASSVNVEIDRLRDAWAAAFNEKDAARVADLYAKDAIYIGPIGTARGRDSIKAAIDRSIQDGVHDLKISTRRREHAGNLVYETGSYTQLDKNGKTQRGDYLVVAKQSAGQWLLTAHAANSSATAPPPSRSH